jgi:hypothetical protein
MIELVKIEPPTMQNKMTFSWVKYVLVEELMYNQLIMNK